MRKILIVILALFFTLSTAQNDSLEIEKQEAFNKKEEEKLYKRMDSLGQKWGISPEAMSLFFKGYVRYGHLDFDLTRLAKINGQEGVRIGMGAKLNEKFHKYISPDAYVAYGFKDRKMKYGIGLDVKTTLEKHSVFRLEYYNDLVSAGRFNEQMWDLKARIMNASVELKNHRFYHYEGVKLSYETDVFQTLTARLSVSKNDETALFDYNFKGSGDSFQNFSTKLTLKYSLHKYQEKSNNFIEKTKYPVFYFNYEKALSDFGGDFKYNKLDFLALHRFYTRYGLTGIRFYAGLIDGEAPIWHHFQMNGLKGNKENQFNYNFFSYLGFAIMEAGKYYNDKMAGFYFTHRLPWVFMKDSSLDVIYRGAIGDMKNMEIHHFDFQKLNRFYQEVGAEWNAFLGLPFNLGFFYRLGHYQTPNFKDNFAVQLKLKFFEF